MIGLKSFALLACVLNVVLLNFRKKNKKRLIQNSHSLVPLPSLATAKSEGMREADIREPRESVIGSYTSRLLDAEESIPVISGMEQRKEDAYFAPVQAHDFR